jgi:hypothetical protein
MTTESQILRHILERRVVRFRELPPVETKERLREALTRLEELRLVGRRKIAQQVVYFPMEAA